MLIIPKMISNTILKLTGKYKKTTNRKYFRYKQNMYTK